MRGFKFKRRDSTAPPLDMFDPEAIAYRLRPCLALAIVALLGDLIQHQFAGSAKAYQTLPCDLLQLLTCFGFASFTYRRQFADLWRTATLVFCLLFVLAAVWSGLRLGEQVPLFVTILVLMTATCALVPWEPRWQNGLTAALFAAAAIDTIAVRPPSPHLGMLWLGALAASALALESNRLWSYWRKEETTEQPESGGGRMQRVLNADLSQLSMVQMRGGRFIFVNEELVANMSHQLRNSLNAIMGMTDLLAETQLGQDQRAYVDTMLVNGGTLLDLITVILDLAKIESGKLRLEEKEFDLEDLVERVAQEQRLHAHEKGLELCVRIEPDVPPRLSGDPMRLRQVLRNLLENAIKFTEHGEVVLTVEGYRLRPRVADLRFSVKDTGIGMTSQQLETIFQAFAQGGASVGREYSGSGLGLAIAKRLVDLMGGQLNVSSEKNVGSTFHFTAEFGVLAPSPEQSIAAARNLNGLHVLVVEDNDSNRLILREFLGSKGAEVVETDKWEYASAELQRQREAGHRYNLILLDCTMPGIDALEVTQRFRNDGIETVIPMITANDLNAKRARLRELGIQAYVVKPVRHAELMHAIGVAQGVTDTADEKSSAAPAKPEPEIEPRRILLADDSPHNRLLIQHYLKDLPYQLDMAENGEVALNKFVHKSYDLVLMDLRMPVMDGHMAVRRMRKFEQDEKRTPTPIIALSASALEQDIRESLETGCTTHLSKPVKKAKLIALIRELTPESHSDAESDGSHPEQAAPPAHLNGHV
jgi:signal transduction histidine kinase/DNA-binding response OmpR family regulator